MLLLPIQQRAGEAQPPDPCDACDEVNPCGGREVLLEALTGWAPPTAASEENPAGMKLTVKNTFINVAAEDDTQSEDMHVTGAKTCQARFSEAEPKEFPAEQADGTDVKLCEDPDASLRSPASGITEAPTASPVGASSAGSRTLSASVSEDSDIRYVVKNTFVEFESAGATPAAAAIQTCKARLGASTPQHLLPAPPGYSAPADFLEEDASPPPAAPPGLVGMQAPTTSCDQSGSSPSASSYMGSPYPEQDDSVRLTVKNTFINVGGPLQDDRYTLSCSARLCGPAPTFPSSGLAAAGTPLAQTQVAAPGTPLAGLPSVGSELHGTLGPEGPACQPCAWFYKDNGCHNGETCRYCHLCPPGELKNRKKQKIARLRNQDKPGQGWRPGVH